MLAWIVNLYKTNAKFRSFVQALEGGAIMAGLTATANGIDFSKKGLTALGSALLGGAGVALRNYFLNRINQPATIDGQKQITMEAPKPVDPTAGLEKPKA